ncbi:cryptochrome/photolyase family protein [Maricaulis salignorans]|uniref:Deoxyribodipyrimidine photo-lyase n=1 Tax=Maricaulis salignorans TaxID=144026 RepID=A0A1G9P7C1_9PROT|nr:deoxyribodipyrimidine photo-lyase [Maricaulis salignorans]SDL94640.1 deoxyribodipyrimidine photo-lyase type I [Maricaulis salignorans]
MATISATGAALVWFRRDLRLADNPALHAAIETGRPLILVFIDQRDRALGTAPGEAADWWLHGSLASLARDITAAGGRLSLLRGDPAELIPGLAREHGIAEVFWNRSGEPGIDVRDRTIAATLQGSGTKPHAFAGTTLINPDALLTGSGTPYKVFGAFWRAALRDLAPRPSLPVPQRLPMAATLPAGAALEDWRLRPANPDWAQGFHDRWQPGEAGAAQRLERFLDDALDDYADGRDRPDKPGTSMLSPHLGFGEISPRQVWHSVQARLAAGTGFQAAERFLAEIGWREFAYYLLHHFDDLRTANFNRNFDHFSWRSDADGLAAWQAGQTGIPMVDAGVRQLWATGWMHNRVRMVCASFLVKHLRCDWRDGMAWFEHTLIDADRAVNAASWQWVAGSGADAAPYFRIFNPVRQGERFDPEGRYVQQWVPELARLPLRWIHQPWKAPAITRQTAGLKLGAGYPFPVCDLAAGRDAALAAYKDMKTVSSDTPPD